MSGGYFEYDRTPVCKIAGEKWYTPFGPDTIKEIETALNFLQIAGIYVERIDRLLEGDDSEAMFHTKLKSQLLRYEEGKK